MSLNPTQQAEKLKQALAEIRANRQHFSEAAFSQIVMLMLDKLRRLQTIEVPEQSPDDEIRLVTVMFIDVKDSTEMLHHFEAGDWKLIIDTVHEQIADIVATWDGQIGQYLGDGVLCFFGAQRSRGDDAPHAVSCALQIQSMLNRYAKKLRDLHGIEFGLRIGISTGRVVVGLIGSQTVKQELLALGPATNLAARLQGVAPVGGVLVDSTTYNRIRRDYVTQAQPPVELRGFDKAINNYYVLGRRTQPATQFTETQVAGIELPLVGRDEDLATISYLCDRSLQNQECQVITLAGDVGMGKSRLLQETIHLTEGHFTHIIMTSQYEARTKSQNLLWDMLMTQCHLTDDMPEAVKLQQIEAYVTEMWEHDDAIKAANAIAFKAGFEVTPPDDNPDEWVLRWFEGVARNEPIVITVDNLQWADTQSITLLEQIAGRLKDQHCVIITAGRPEYKTRYPNYMRACANHTVIELEALHLDATLSIIRTIFSKVGKIPPTLAYSINERVEGNPLFVQEYLSMLFDNNVFKPDAEGGWRFNIIMLDVALNTLPDGLLGILQARLDDLPDQARQVIQAAAISGQKFWEDALQNLVSSVSTPSMIQRLITQGMIVPDQSSIFEGETQYHFRHSLYRDVAYEMIPRAKREEYHSAMSSWLLQRIAGQAEYYPLLAEQFAHSGEYLAALYTYLEAVEVQIEKKLELKALNLIDTALSLAAKIDRDEALAVVAKLWAYRGEALITLERFEEASAASQSSLMLLQELSDDQLVDSRISAERIHGLANLSLGRYTDAYDALTRAHNLLPLTAIGQITTVLQTMGKLYYYQGRLQDSHAYLRRAYDNANKTQHLNLIATSLSQLAQIDVEQGDFAEALVKQEAALQMNRSLELIPEQANDLFNIGLVHLMTLNFGKAYEYFSDAEYLNTTFGYANILVQGYRALTLILLARTTQGKALLMDALDNVPKDVNMQHQLQLVNVFSLITLGDYVQGRDRALAFVQQENLNPILKARAYRLLGLASHNLGTHDTENYLDKALQDEITYGGRDVWLCHASLAEWCKDETQKLEHYKKASELILKRATSLEERPDMKQGFLENPLVVDILKYAKPEISISE